MLQMMRELIAHKGYANTLLLTAIRNQREAAGDPEVVTLLHHILVANRFWFSLIVGRPFDMDRETAPVTSLDALVDLYVDTQAEEEAWILGATEADLERVLDNPLIPGCRCTVAQGIMQVAMHSQGHRAQLAKMLRRHGGVPPMTDYILWLSGHRA